MNYLVLLPVFPGQFSSLRAIIDLAHFHTAFLRNQESVPNNTSTTSQKFSIVWA